MFIFIKDYILPFMPTFLTILGWWIVNKKDTIKRNLDIHNGRVEKAIELLDELVIDIQDYYRIEGNSEEAIKLSSKITTDLKRLSKRINLIDNSITKSETDHLGSAFIEFKKTATGGDFEQANRSALYPNNQKFNDINDTHNELYLALEKVIKI